MRRILLQLILGSTLRRRLEGARTGKIVWTGGSHVAMDVDAITASLTGLLLQGHIQSPKLERHLSETKTQRFGVRAPVYSFSESLRGPC